MRATPSRPDLAGAAGGAIVAGALLALGELLAGVTLGGFFAEERAEPFVFLLFRPWLLLGAALLLRRRRARQCWAAYGAYLLLASAAEAALLWAMGGGTRELGILMLGGMAVLPLIVLLELAMWGGERLHRSSGAALALAGCAALFLATDLPGRAQQLVAGQRADARLPRPRVGLASALPLAWGEAGPFAPGARPAEAYRLLGGEYDLVPLDLLADASLAPLRAVLLVQPRALAPSELVALDAWVRGGGRALILTDPVLRWPSGLALGDIRRPPPVGLLGPLLDHWGLALLPPGSGEGAIVDERVAGRRLVTAAPGRLASRGRTCRVMESGLLARCRIGRGTALVLADADLLHDDLWIGPGPRGTEHVGRAADNPRVVSDLLDLLLGRAPATDRVNWFAPGRDPRPALLAALTIPLIVLISGLLVRGRGRRFTELSTGLQTVERNGDGIA